MCVGLFVFIEQVRLSCRMFKVAISFIANWVENVQVDVINLGFFILHGARVRLIERTVTCFSFINYLNPLHIHVSFCLGWVVQGERDL